jgi:hypothetical protein
MNNQRRLNNIPNYVFFIKQLIYFDKDENFCLFQALNIDSSTVKYIWKINLFHFFYVKSYKLVNFIVN